MKKLSLIVILLTFVWTFLAAAGEKGWFGFDLKVKGEGLINPTVRSVTIDSIALNPPAVSEARIAAGDQIIQIESTEVPGHKANDLKPLMEKKVGEAIHLRLKRISGEIYSVTLTAAKRPD